MTEYYQVREKTVYSPEYDEITHEEKDFEKLEDAEAYLAERIKAFEELAASIAEETGNYDHCEYEEGVLISVEHSNDYTDYRPELLIKPLH